MKDVTTRLSHEFGLSDEERSETLPSGNARVIVNRIGWAKAYLKEAGLLGSVRRGTIQITEQGRAVLAENRDRIDMTYLERFPAYLDFLQRKRKPGDKDPPEPPELLSKRTPDDLPQYRTEASGY